MQEIESTAKKLTALLAGALAVFLLAGAANAATEKLVARALGVATSRCRIVRGATSRAKVLSVSP